MKKLTVDIETFSPVDLGKAGVYRYSEHPEFKILLFAYSVDDAPVRVVDVDNGEEIPGSIIDALHDPRIIKHAYNAAFERICISRHLGIDSFLDPVSWRCDMIHAAYHGLPLALDACAKALELDTLKDYRGKALIRLFSRPASSDGTGRVTRADEPEKWEQFKQYCARDVEVEKLVADKLSWLPVPASEWEHYQIDQRINDRGIRLDTTLVKNALASDYAQRRHLTSKLQAVTRLPNPNSTNQLLAWLADNGAKLNNLQAGTVREAIDSLPESSIARLALEYRRELAKTSTKKYEAMAHSLSRKDARARGLIQFYGANRTGRYAGRLIQVQNLPRNYLPDLDAARELAKTSDHKTIELLYGSVSDTLSQLTRTAFIPSPGNVLHVADYSAIEARVLAWLAGESWRLEAFEKGEDIYCASASRMFKVPVEKHGENSHLRQKGKIAELALGYGGSVGALEAMGAAAMGLTGGELPGLVRSWRNTNQHITALWRDLESKAAYTVRSGRPSTAGDGRVAFAKKNHHLFAQLPSGRLLTYPDAQVARGRHGNPAITYTGVNDRRVWGRLETYGGKLTENITQAIARDLLAEALKRTEQSGLPVVMHVHDEIVVDAPPDQVNTRKLVDSMRALPVWAGGLPLDAEAYTTPYYRKD